VLKRNNKLWVGRLQTQHWSTAALPVISIPLIDVEKAKEKRTLAITPVGVEKVTEISR
jgi:hypothetical protein